MISEHEMTSIITAAMEHYGTPLDERTVRRLAAATAGRATQHATERYSQGYAAGRHDGATSGPPLRPLLRDQALRDRIAGIALLLPQHPHNLYRLRIDLLVALDAHPGDDDVLDAAGVFDDPLLRDALERVAVLHSDEADDGTEREYGTPAIDDQDLVAALVAWSDARHAQPAPLTPGGAAQPYVAVEDHGDTHALRCTGCARMVELYYHLDAPGEAGTLLSTITDLAAHTCEAPA